MDENTGVPIVPPNSENEFLENIQIEFNGLGVSSIEGGQSRKYMISHTNTNSAINNSMLVSTPAQTRPTSGGEELMPPLPKRRRGRPPGSKNKQKNPIEVDEEVDNIMRVIFIDAGNDIVENLLNFAQSRNASITVLSGSGLVSDVTLLHHASRTPAVPIIGTFCMISLEGTYNNPNCGDIPPQLITNPPCSSFSIRLSSAEGNLFCGTIGGKVKAASQVVITATLSKKPMFYEIDLINQDRVFVEPNIVDNSVVGPNSTLLTRKPPPRTE